MILLVSAREAADARRDEVQRGLHPEHGRLVLSIGRFGATGATGATGALGLVCGAAIEIVLV
jgi:hypothetical protein